MSNQTPKPTMQKSHRNYRRLFHAAILFLALLPLAAQAVLTTYSYYFTNDGPVGVYAYLVMPTTNYPESFNNLTNITPPVICNPGTMTLLVTAGSLNNLPLLEEFEAQTPYLAVCASNATYGTTAALIVTNWAWPGSGANDFSTNSLSACMSMTNGFNYASFPAPPLH